MGSPAEAGQPPRSPRAGMEPITEPVTVGQPADPAASDLAAWEPGVTDADVEKIENEIVPEDLQTAADERALYAIRRREDRAWLEEVRATGFTGPVFELYWEELMRYGMAVMLAWTRTGRIMAECRKKNRPLEVLAPGGCGWSDADRLELAGETVAIALRYFLQKVLMPGRWRYGGGASLRTFFVGACLLQFPNVYGRWAREQRRWAETHDTDTALDDAEMGWVGGELSRKDPTGNAVIRHATVNSVLAEVKNPVARRAIKMVIIDGAKQDEAAEALGVTPRAVEAYIRRFRTAARARFEQEGGQ